MNWPTITFLFEPADLWVGAYFDRSKRRLYLLPLPTVGLVLSWPKPIPEVPQVAPKPDLPIIIVAYSFEEARRYAWANGMKGRWDYAANAHNLHGYRKVRLIKLDGWEAKKTVEFLDAVKRLEAGL